MFVEMYLPTTTQLIIIPSFPCISAFSRTCEPESQETQGPFGRTRPQGLLITPQVGAQGTYSMECLRDFGAALLLSSKFSFPFNELKDQLKI